MKTLNEIEELLSEKIITNNKEIQEYSDKITEAETQILRANEDLLTAEKEIKVEDYNKAKNDIWAATNAKELYSKEKEKLAQTPLISKNEYNQLLNEIINSADQEHEEQNKRAVALVAELKSIAEKSAYTNKQANQLMNTLQRKVYKEPQGMIPTPNGGKTLSRDKTYNYVEAVNNFYSRLRGTYLSLRVGEDVENKSSIWNR